MERHLRLAVGVLVAQLGASVVVTRSVQRAATSGVALSRRALAQLSSALETIEAPRRASSPP
jgi:hypothetical protein